ncbi:hypothetical protein AKJ61_02610 [candidate division MSBL1 archaeon SCGC-AAA259B11]|uniref:Transposase IS4-like domain-containing protein n=1 Tax=candidate division MSBL1 archaeon SCGC-AAA259B11 TaxID=1698260 RepID=A0A133U5S6_9EURY|nr:hypothetical protein AKJ61_02610 [candidate division MSBL1 archaeon SCGC-AAA259B11]
MAEGIPVAHKVWGGNTVDVSTLKTTVDELKERLGVEKWCSSPIEGSSPPITWRIWRRWVTTISFRPKGGGKTWWRISYRKRLRGRERLSPKKSIQRTAESTWSASTAKGERTNSKIWTISAMSAREKLGELKEKAERRTIKPSKFEKKVENALGKNKRLFDYNVEGGLSYRIDEEKWNYERAIAGKFLLVTTTDLNSFNVMIAYKNLKDVERAFDELKNLLKLRPVFNRTINASKPTSSFATSPC